MDGKHEAGPQFVIGGGVQPMVGGIWSVVGGGGGALTHDTLFGQLTVLQNLAFYARIFGKTAKDVDHVVHELQIQNCAHRCLETLSAGPLP